MEMLKDKISKLMKLLFEISDTLRQNIVPAATRPDILESLLLQSEFP